MPKSDLDKEMFKTSGMQRAAKRDAMGKQFGIGNFFAWAMEKYPRLTLGQLEDKMPSLEREYNQEKTMRRERPDEVPTVSPFSDDEKEVKKAKGLESLNLDEIRTDYGIAEKYKYANTEEKLEDMIKSHQFDIDNNDPDDINVQDHEEAIDWYEGLLDQHRKTGEDTFHAPFGGDTAWREMIQQEMEDIDLYKPHEQGDMRGFDDLPENTKDPESKGDCEPCNGTGYKDGDMKSLKACPKCDGDGESPGFGGTKAFEELNRMRKLAGLPIMEDDTVTKIAIGHVDDESDMMRKELYKIGKYSVELYKMLGDLPDGDFPHWWQGKIVKAGEYIGSAKHYLEGELYSPEEESPLDKEPEDKDDINPSGV